MLAPEMTKQFAAKAAEKEGEKGEEVKEGEEGEEGEEAAQEAVEEGEESAQEAAPSTEATPPADAETAETPATEPSSTSTEASADAATTTTDAGTEPKAAASRPSSSSKLKRQLAAGEFKFALPPFAAPFLFVPPHLEVSYTTCSTIYLRHPTLSRQTTTRADEKTGEVTSGTSIRSDIATPFNAQGELFNLAWEFYTKNSPRVRGDLRRLRLEAKEGRNGIESARAKDEWKRKVAQRRGWLKTSSTYTHAAYATRRRRGMRTRKVYGHKVGHHFLGAKMVPSRRGLKGAL